MPQIKEIDYCKGCTPETVVRGINGGVVITREPCTRNNQLAFCIQSGKISELRAKELCPCALANLARELGNQITSFPDMFGEAQG